MYEGEKIVDKVREVLQFRLPTKRDEMYQKSVTSEYKRIEKRLLKNAKHGKLYTYTILNRDMVILLKRKMIREGYLISQYYFPFLYIVHPVNCNVN